MKVELKPRTVQTSDGRSNKTWTAIVRHEKGCLRISERQAVALVELLPYSEPVGIRGLSMWVQTAQTLSSLALVLWSCNHYTVVLTAAGRDVANALVAAHAFKGAA